MNPALDTTTTCYFDSRIERGCYLVNIELRPPDTCADWRLFPYLALDRVLLEQITQRLANELFGSTYNIQQQYCSQYHGKNIFHSNASS